jgi:type IV pilus assembly protein PilM
LQIQTGKVIKMISFGASKGVIGLDIGASSIKVVQMKRGNPPSLVNYAVVDLPEDGVVVDGNIADAETAAECIKEAIGQLSSKGFPIHSALSGQNVIVRFIHMPMMNEDDLAETIKFEAEQYVPYPIEDVALDFASLSQVESDVGAGQLLILLVVAQKEQIGTFMGCLRQANVVPEVLDVDTFAVINALNKSIHGENGENVVSVIDIGAATSNISILKDGVLQFTRSIPIAGNNITSVIQNVLKLDFEQAENVKIQEGIALDDEENEVSEVVRTIVEELVGEIRRSFDYYKAQHRESQIDKLIITGGTSKLKNIDVFMANELGYEVEIGDPLMDVEVEIEDQDDFQNKILELTVAIGLALRGVVD